MTATEHRTETKPSPEIPCELPDDILVARTVAGDSCAFEIIVQRYRRVLIAVGLRMTGSFADAEDIAQQTFLKAFLALPRFEGRSSFSTWLTSIAINETLMWRRKKARRREVVILSDDAGENTAQTPDVADSKPDPESICSEAERRVALRSRIAHLRPALRSALEVCDLQEESTHAAALLLGITVSALKSRRSRGRAALRGAMARYS